MGFLAEKYNYVQGLCDGLDLDKNSKEGKLFSAMMELLSEIVLSVEDLEESTEEINEIIDEIDEDLAELEEIIFEEDCECEEDDMIECPECNASLEILDDWITDDGIKFNCPACGKDIAVEFHCDCDDCCDC